MLYAEQLGRELDWADADLLPRLLPPGKRDGRDPCDDRDEDSGQDARERARQQGHDHPGEDAEHYCELRAPAVGHAARVADAGQGHLG